MYMQTSAQTFLPVRVSVPDPNQPASRSDLCWGWFGSGAGTTRNPCVKGLQGGDTPIDAVVRAATGVKKS